MAVEIPGSSLQDTAFIIAVVGVSVAIMATALRFVATKRAGRRPNWEDWFAALSTFFFIAYVVPFLYFLRVYRGRSITMEDIVNMTKAGYVMAAQFCMQQLFAKLSLLFLYYRLFNPNRPFIRCLYVVGTVQLLWSIATYLVHWFQCSPPAKLWDPTLKGHCINSSAFLVAGETPNSLVDFILVGLAIWMVQSLRMKTSVKLNLTFLFALGGLTGILGFVKIGENFSAMNRLEFALMDPIWATVQQACSVICCCAPIYKPLFPKLGLSFSSRIFGNKTSSGMYFQSVQAGTSDLSGQKHEGQEPSVSQLDPQNYVGRMGQV